MIMNQNLIITNQNRVKKFIKYEKEEEKNEIEWIKWRENSCRYDLGYFNYA